MHGCPCIPYIYLSNAKSTVTLTNQFRQLHFLLAGLSNLVIFRVQDKLLIPKTYCEEMRFFTIGNHRLIFKGIFTCDNNRLRDVHIQFVIPHTQVFTK